MEELRFSKRLRAKTHSSQLIINSNSTPSLLHHSLPRPPYHPALGSVISPSQLETLRRHITVYASICQQLSLMHTLAPPTVTPPPNGAAASSAARESVTANKTTRFRWAPSREQVQTLERIYESGVGTPSKEQVRDITSHLSKYGPVTETRVYNWFQNRKAKSRRKSRESEYEDTDVYKSSPPSALAIGRSRLSESPAGVRVSLNGERFDAPAGCFNVKQVFGEGVELVTEQGELVPVDQNGVTLQTLLPGLRYNLRERSNATQTSDAELGESERSKCDTQEQAELRNCPSSEPSELGTGPADIMHEQSISVEENTSLPTLVLSAGIHKPADESVDEQRDATTESIGEPSNKVFAKRSMLPVHKSSSPA